MHFKLIVRAPLTRLASIATLSPSGRGKKADQLATNITEIGASLEMPAAVSPK
jgi:hypothetical protein